MELTEHIDPETGSATRGADEFAIDDLQSTRRAGEGLVSLVKISVNPCDGRAWLRTPSAQLFAQSLQPDGLVASVDRIDFI
jgi:hypothetical protein